MVSLRPKSEDPIIDYKVLQKMKDTEVRLVTRKNSSGKEYSSVIKTIEVDQDMLPYLELEFEMMEKLSSQTNVVKPFTKRYSEGKLIVEMEFWGKNLQNAKKEIFQKGGELSPSQTLDWLRQCVDILTVVSENNIYHGDLKPANILLNSGKIKLVDFGISMEIQKNLFEGTATRTLIGMTPPYAAPELLSAGYTEGCRSRFSPTKADVYSLGMTFLDLAFMDLKHYNKKLEELQVLRYPFGLHGDKNIGYNYDEFLYFIQKQEFRGVNQEIGNKLKIILIACLQENHQNRPTFSQLKHVFEVIETTTAEELRELLRVSQGFEELRVQVPFSHVVIHLNFLELVKIYECRVCEGLAISPYQCRGCQAYFCDICLQDSSNYKYCPGCFGKILHCIARDKIILNLYNQIKVKCENTEKGCEQVLPLDKLREHYKHCSFRKETELLAAVEEQKSKGDWKSVMKNTKLLLLESLRIGKEQTHAHADLLAEISEVYESMGEDAKRHIYWLQEQIIRSKMHYYQGKDEYSQGKNIAAKNSGVSALQYAKEGNISNDFKGKCLLLIGTALEKDLFIPEAKAALDSAIELLDNDTSNMAWAHYHLAKIFNAKKNPTQACLEYEIALNIYKNCPNVGPVHEITAGIYYNIGVIYKDVGGEYIKEARKYFQEACTIYDQIDAPSADSGWAYFLLGGIETNKTLKAKYLFKGWEHFNAVFGPQNRWTQNSWKICGKQKENKVLCSKIQAEEKRKAKEAKVFAKLQAKEKTKTNNPEKKYTI